MSAMLTRVTARPGLMVFAPEKLAVDINITLVPKFTHNPGRLRWWRL